MNVPTASLLRVALGTSLLALALCPACEAGPSTSAPVAGIGGSDAGGSGDLPDTAGGQAGANANADVTTDSETGVTADADASMPVKFCAGPTTFPYDPVGSGELQLWPDNRLTRQDPASPTGLRLDVSAEKAPWASSVSGFLAPSFDEFGALSGFARNGAVIMRFTGAVGAGPATPEQSVSTDALVFVDLSTTPPTRIPYTAGLADQDRDLFVQPLVPLRRGALHAVILTNSHLDANGVCIAPSEVQRALLTGSAPDASFAELEKSFALALAATGLAPDHVSGMTVFTTHDDIEVTRQAAISAHEAADPWKLRLGCNVVGELRQCEVVFRSLDFRTGRFLATPTGKSTWDVPATVWLPASGQGPFPFLLFGHGLGNTRAEGAEVAAVVAPLGFAVVAADAMRHNEPPPCRSTTTRSGAPSSWGST